MIKVFELCFAYSHKYLFLMIFKALSQNFERRLLGSLYPSVCPSAWKNSASTVRIFFKLDIWEFIENLSGKFKFN